MGPDFKIKTDSSKSLQLHSTIGEPGFGARASVSAFGIGATNVLALKPVVSAALTDLWQDTSRFEASMGLRAVIISPITLLAAAASFGNLGGGSKPPLITHTLNAELAYEHTRGSDGGFAPRLTATTEIPLITRSERSLQLSFGLQTTPSNSLLDKPVFILGLTGNLP